MDRATVQVVDEEMAHWQQEHRKGELGYCEFDRVPARVVRAACTQYLSDPGRDEREALHAVYGHAGVAGGIDGRGAGRLAGAALPAAPAQPAAMTDDALSLSGGPGRGSTGQRLAVTPSAASRWRKRLTRPVWCSSSQSAMACSSARMFSQTVAISPWPASRAATISAR